jgi:hypothetical protein
VQAVSAKTEISPVVVANIVKVTGATIQEAFEALAAFEGDQEQAVMFLLISASKSKSHGLDAVQKEKRKLEPKASEISDAFGHIFRSNGELS